MTEDSVQNLHKAIATIEQAIKNIQSEPIPADAPLLYEEHYLNIWGTPEYYGGDKYYIEHTGGRSDLGVVLVSEGSELHSLIRGLVSKNES